MSATPGRPKGRISTPRIHLERGIAHALGEKPDDPEYAAGLLRNRRTEPQKRADKRAVQDQWASNAYWFYCELMRRVREPKRDIRTLEIPELFEITIPLVRRELPADVVASWAYARRRLHRSYTKIAESQGAHQGSEEREASARTRLAGARAARDRDATARREGALDTLLKSRDTLDGTRTRSDDSIRKAVTEYRWIWRLAEENFV